MPRYKYEKFLEDLNSGKYANGGYPKYFITSDGEALSYDSAKKNQELIVESIKAELNDCWMVIGCEINWEDTSLFCSDTSKKIESAYGEDK
jgi:hypothetical protein